MIYFEFQNKNILEYRIILSVSLWDDESLQIFVVMKCHRLMNNSSNLNSTGNLPLKEKYSHHFLFYCLKYGEKSFWLNTI